LKPAETQNGASSNGAEKTAKADEKVVLEKTPAGMVVPRMAAPTNRSPNDNRATRNLILGR